MVFYKLLFLCLFLALRVEAAPLPELDRLVRENNLLKSEHQLAKTPQVYVLFDLVEKEDLHQGQRNCVEGAVHRFS